MQQDTITIYLLYKKYNFLIFILFQYNKSTNVQEYIKKEKLFLKKEISFNRKKKYILIYFNTGKKIYNLENISN